MIVLGIDPGLANTGWAIVASEGSRQRAIAYGTLSTKASEPLALRLKAIYKEISEAIERFNPDVCAIEDVYFGVNARSALALGQARGIAIFAAINHGLEIHEFAPAKIKQTVTGNGRASKEQITYMVSALLKLENPPKSEHASDALAIALTYCSNCPPHGIHGKS